MDSGSARLGAAGQGGAGQSMDHGSARLGVARQGGAGQGVAWQGMARQ
jgi:hypothetical protein